MNGNGSLSEHSATNGASPAKTKKAGLSKEKSKGFGQFFKIGSGKKSEKGGAAVREGEACTASPNPCPNVASRRKVVKMLGGVRVDRVSSMTGECHDENS